MMYVRGSDQDYENWASLAKDDGWSAKYMKNYMRKHQVSFFTMYLNINRSIGLDPGANRSGDY